MPKHRRDDQGASAVEYGLMVAAIAALIVGTVFALGSFVKGAFDTTCQALNDPRGASCTVPADTGGDTPPADQPPADGS